MNSVIESLARKCKNRHFLMHQKLIDKVVDLTLNSELKEETKLSLLIEVYRYTYYSQVRIAIDPRVDVSMKSSTLIRIENALSENKITEEQIDDFKQFNDLMREHIDSPVEYIENEIKFYSEHPNPRF